MATLKGCHCNHCRSRHKPAPIPGYQGRRNSSRHNSCSKIYTGDEHWTKVLQASEGGQGPSNRQRQPSICDRCHQLHVTRFSKHCSLSSSSTSAFRNPKNKRMKNVFQSLYSRFCDWFGSSCQGFGSSFLSRFTSCRQSPLSDNGFPEQTKEEVTEGLLVKVNLDDVSALLSKSCKRETRMLCHYTSQSSEESEFGSVWTSCSSSSDLTAGSNSTVSSSEGCVTFQSNRLLPGVCFESTCLKGQVTSVEEKSNSNVSPKQQRTPRPQTRTAYHLSMFKINGCHLKSSSLSLPEKEELRPDRFYRTWPLSNNNQEDSGKKSSLLVTSSSLLPMQELSSGTTVTEEVLHESSIEWSIPYTDLTFDQIIRRGARHQIFRGRWHGDVLIHTYCDLGEKEVTVFLKQVSELSRIRHENICLFMGACIHLPNLAVITSDLKGPSLYEKIHLLSDKMSMRSRVSIARQVSVAMGYLHAKGVLACKLNSRNIHLEPKVKLSLLDHGMTEIIHQRSNCACLPRGNICYAAPEMLSTLVVMHSRLHCTFSSTQETDVFAFGTLLYELFTEQFPFSGSSVETLIWRVCKGRPPKLAHLNCNSALKVLIERCWSHQPNNRPSFSEINQELQQKTGLHKCHSSSQPERLNQNMFQAAGRPHPLYRMARQQ